MARREEATRSQSNQEPTQWTVWWESTGHYRAAAGEATVTGWAADPLVVAQELRHWSCPPRTAEVRWADGQPESEDRLLTMDDRWPCLTNEQVTASFGARPDRLAQVVTAIEELRERWSRREIRQRVAELIRQLQQSEPQLPPIHREFRREEEKWSKSISGEWVPTDSIVTAVDEVWGEFDRAEPERRARWIPDRTRELLAAEDIAVFLAEHFADGTYGTVRLCRLPGPGGPLYAVAEGGAHRTHLSRILRLPWMFAQTILVSTPRKLKVTDVTKGGIPACEATQALWEGLLRRGVIHGRITMQGAFATLHLDYTPALWLLLPAKLATAYNDRYEQLHPGALGAVGIPSDAYRSSESWQSWLTG